MVGLIFLFFDLSCSSFKAFPTGVSVRIAVCLLFLPLLLPFQGPAFSNGRTFSGVGNDFLGDLLGTECSRAGGIDVEVDGTGSKGNSVEEPEVWLEI